jgi:transcription initiation factor IIE alpha subunit
LGTASGGKERIPGLLSDEDLQELSGRGKNTVLRAIKLLKHKKLITVTRTQGDCCIYDVNTIPRRLVESIIEEKYKKESKA